MKAITLALIIVCLAITESYGQRTPPPKEPPPNILVPKSPEIKPPTDRPPTKIHEKAPLNGGPTPIKTPAAAASSPGHLFLPLSARPYFHVASLKIKAAKPDISDAMLAADAEVLDGVFSELRAKFLAAGFNADEAAAAILTGWEAIRIGARALKPTANLAAEILVNYVDSLGLLIITSTPEGADIYLNGTKLEDPTNAIKWVGPGKYKVRLAKPPNYGEHENECTVKELKKTEVKIELIPTVRNP